MNWEKDLIVLAEGFGLFFSLTMVYFLLFKLKRWSSKLLQAILVRTRLPVYVFFLSLAL